MPNLNISQITPGSDAFFGSLVRNINGVGVCWHLIFNCKIFVTNIGRYYKHRLIDTPVHSLVQELRVLQAKSSSRHNNHHKLPQYYIHCHGNKFHSGMHHRGHTFHHDNFHHRHAKQSNLTLQLNPVQALWFAVHFFCNSVSLFSPII